MGIYLFKMKQKCIYIPRNIKSVNCKNHKLNSACKKIELKHDSK